MMDTIDQMRHVLRHVSMICRNSTGCDHCLLDGVCHSKDGYACPESWDEDDIERLTMKEGQSWTISLNP